MTQKYMSSRIFCSVSLFFPLFIIIIVVVSIVLKMFIEYICQNMTEKRQAIRETSLHFSR